MAKSQSKSSDTFSCRQENLAAGLGLVGHIVKERTTLPVLSNILLATDNGSLKLAATDLAIGITCRVGAKVEADGAITLPARALVDWVTALSQDLVTVSLNGSATARLSAGRFQSTLKGIDAQEFPIIPLFDEGQAVARIAPEALATMIDQVAFAAAKDESRPILTGALAQFEGDRFTLAAADGFRLSARTMTLDAPVSQPLEAIIPARALQELGRVLAKSKTDDGVAIALRAGASASEPAQVMFNVGSVELVSQVIDGNYPDYRAIIPNAHSARVVADTAALLKACKVAEVFARGGVNVVRVTVTPGPEQTLSEVPAPALSEVEGEPKRESKDEAPGRIMIKAVSAETGDSAGEVDAVVEGSPIEIGFNVDYLIDALKAMKTPQVSIELNAPDKPGVLRPVGDDAFAHVIMPMQIGR